MIQRHSKFGSVQCICCTLHVKHSVLVMWCICSNAWGWMCSPLPSFSETPPGPEGDIHSSGLFFPSNYHLKLILVFLFYACWGNSTTLKPLQNFCMALQSLGPGSDLCLWWWAMESQCWGEKTQQLKGFCLNSFLTSDIVMKQIYRNPDADFSPVWSQPDVTVKRKNLGKAWEEPHSHSQWSPFSSGWPRIVGY